MYAEVVREVPPAAIEAAEAEGIDEHDAARIERWKALIAEHGAPFPQNTLDQVREGIEAVWRSWNRPRARRYRRFRGIAEDLGTAVTVQAMVFGNLDNDSSTSVVFTRDPGRARPRCTATSSLRPGEDVVNGTTTPETVDALRATPRASVHLQAATEALEADTVTCATSSSPCSTDGCSAPGAPGQRSPAAAVRSPSSTYTRSDRKRPPPSASPSGRPATAIAPRDRPRRRTVVADSSPPRPAPASAPWWWTPPRRGISPGQRDPVLLFRRRRRRTSTG